MIIKGNPRRDVDFWAAHLMRTDQNERVALVDIRGLAGESVRDCLVELDAIAQGTRTKNGFYVASLNPRDDETLTNEQWTTAADRLEENLGLAGQPRFIVEHEKEGRTHRHVVWGRIDADTMKAIPADFNFARHEQTSRELEELFGLEPVTVEPRAERGPKDWETFRAQDSGIDPKEMALEITALWQGADSGLAFKAALEDAGYILARGDRRDFVIIDQAGDDHSITRRTGAKAAEVRARLADIDRDALPSVAEARELARAQADTSTGGELPEPEPDAQPTDTNDQRTAADAQDAPRQNPAEMEDVVERSAADFEDVAPRDLADYEPVRERSADDFEDVAARDPADYEPVRERTADDFIDEPEQRGEHRRITPWGRAWNAVAERAREYAAHLAEFWHAPHDGEAQEGTWQRLVADTRRSVSDYLKRDSKDLYADVSRTVQDILARGSKSTPGSEHAEGTRWAERVAAKARGYVRSEGGGGINPFDVFEEYARAWLEGDSMPEPGGIDADTSPEPENSGPDFPDPG
jgi:hypothetical protein